MRRAPSCRRAVLTLYDPRRAQSIIGNGQIDTWERFVTVVFERRQRLLARGGEGLRLLTGTITSPSLAAQIAAIQHELPGNALAFLGTAQSRH